MGLGIRSLLVRTYTEFCLRRELSKLTREIRIFYTGVNSPLDTLANKYHTDKGGGMKAGEKFPWPCHTYTDLYYLLFCMSRTSTKRVFEFGLGSNDESIPNAMTAFGKPGASLRLWREFFPMAQIYGADIDKNVLFSDDRIRTFYCNQLDSTSLIDMWVLVGESDFDVIVDDGLHTFEAGKNTFDVSVRHLSTDGLYIIEDVSDVDMLRFLAYFEGLPQYSAMFVSMFDCVLKPVDNNVIVVRHNAAVSTLVVDDVMHSEA